MKQTTISFIIAILALIAWFIFKPMQSLEMPTNEVLQLTSCLKEKSVTMFGTDTCEFCQKQKKEFGLAFKEVNYVNCAFQSERCQQEKIESYPTWSYDGKHYPGILDLDQLAKLTNCPNKS